MVKRKHGGEKNTTTLCSVNEFEQIVGSERFDEEFMRLRERERKKERKQRLESGHIAARLFLSRFMYGKLGLDEKDRTVRVPFPASTWLNEGFETRLRNNINIFF